MSKKICSECHQEIKPSHKEVMNKKLLDGLQLAAKSIKRSRQNDFNLAEIRADYNAYNNFQKLRYFGLVHYVKDAAGNRKRGHWLITRNGWAYLRGERQVHKYVIIKENSIQSRSDALISVQDVYRGADTITTRFEYFDDEGNMVGFRPAPAFQPLKQVALL